MWPEQYESMLYKQSHNRAIYGRRFLNDKQFVAGETTHEPIIDRETWEKTQEAMQDQNMGSMTMG